MITLRRIDERDRARRKQEVWRTFDEHHLAPGARVPRRAHHDAEIVTFVREGSLAYEDSTGRSGVIPAGEFQHRAAGRGIHHSERNASRTDRVHVFQVCLRASQTELAPDHEQKRFCAAERRGGLRVVASPDARRGSLRLRQDTLIYSAILDPGKHVVHELLAGRTAWLYLLLGEVTLGDIVLTTGDGAAIAAERAVSLTAREETELLLVDFGERMGPDPAPDDGGVHLAAGVGDA